MKGIVKRLVKYKDNFNRKEKQQHISFLYNASSFYGIPNIRKPKLIQNVITEQQKENVNIIESSDSRLRPIVAGPIRPTRTL